MRWFKTDEKGLVYEVKEWEAALKNVEDLESMTALGRKVYGDCIRASSSIRGVEMDKAIAAFAHVLHHMMDNMDGSLTSELVWILEEGWTINERAFWESPEAMLKGYAPLIDGNSKDATVVERIGRDLLTVARPNLVRLVWAMLVSEGRRVELRGVEQADRAGDSMIVPLALFDRLLAEGVPEMLDDEEMTGLLHLARTLSIGTKDGVETDELLHAVIERSYMLDNGGVWLWPYLRSEEGIHVSHATLCDWAARTAQSLSALIAFKVMLVATVAGEQGRLNVMLPRRGSKQKD